MALFTRRKKDEEDVPALNKVVQAEQAVQNAEAKRDKAVMNYALKNPVTPAMPKLNPVEEIHRQREQQRLTEDYNQRQASKEIPVLSIPKNNVVPETKRSQPHTDRISPVPKNSFSAPVPVTRLAETKQEPEGSRDYSGKGSFLRSLQARDALQEAQQPESYVTPRDALGYSAADYNGPNSANLWQEMRPKYVSGSNARYRRGDIVEINEGTISRLDNYANKVSGGQTFTQDELNDFQNIAHTLALDLEEKIKNKSVTDSDLDMLNALDHIYTGALVSRTTESERPEGGYDIQEYTQPAFGANEAFLNAVSDQALRLPSLIYGGIMGDDPEYQAWKTARDTQREALAGAHPYATMGGNVAGNAMMYALANAAAGGAGLTDQLASRLAISNPVLAEHAANMIVGQGIDNALDVIPSAVRNYQNGMRGWELAGSIAKDEFVNAVYNGLAEIPGLTKGLLNQNAVPALGDMSKEQIDDMAEAVAKNLQAEDAAKTLQAEDIAKAVNPADAAKPIQFEDLTNGEVIDLAEAAKNQNAGSIRQIANQDVSQIEWPLRRATENDGPITQKALMPVDDFSLRAKQGDAYNPKVPEFQKIRKLAENEPFSAQKELSEIMKADPTIPRVYNGNRKTAEVIAEETAAFEKQIMDYESGRLPLNQRFIVGETPDIYVKNGMKKGPLYLSQKDFDKISMPEGFNRFKQKKNHLHGLGKEGTLSLIDGINDPLAIMTSHDGSLVSFVPYVNENGDQLIAVLRSSKSNRLTLANDIQSYYDKQGIENFIRKSVEKNGERFLYINEKRVLGATGTGLQSPDPATLPTLSSANNIADSTKSFNTPSGRTMAEDIGLRGSGKATGSLEGVVNEDEPRNALEAMLREKGLTLDEWLEQTYGPEKAAEMKKALGGLDPSTATGGTLPEAELSVPYNKDLQEKLEILSTPDTPKVDDGRPYWETQGKNEKTFFGDPEIDNGYKERGFAESVRKEGKVPDEVRKELTDKPIEYKQLSNKVTAERAAELWEQTSDSFDTAEETLAKLIDDNDAAAAVYAKNLVTAYSEAGQVESAMKVMDQISAAMTKRGQFNQAAVLALAKDDPMTALKYAQRAIDRLNVDGAKKFGKKWHDFSLTDAEKQAFTQIKTGDQKAIESLYDAIGKRIGAEYPSKAIEKFLEARRIGMLFNVRTNVRNFGANPPTMAMRYVSDRIEGVGQNIAKIINPDFEVTQSIGPIGKKYRALAKEVFEGDTVQNLLKGTNNKHGQLPDIQSNIMKDRQIFKGTFLSHWINNMTDGGLERLNKKFFDKEHVKSIAETFRNATYKFLELGDDPFVKENFVERLGSYLKAQGIDDISNVPDEAIMTAWEEAMKATYKDQSWAVNAIGGLKKDIQKIPYIGKVTADAVLPFVQAPANIAARMVDYGPRGLKGLVDIASGAKANNLEQVTKGIEELSKGLTGAGMVFAGRALYKSGLLTGAYADDKDQKEFQKQTGYKEYALHIGDKYFEYNWAQPFAEPFMIGALVQDAIDRSDAIDDRILQELGEDNPTVGAASLVANTALKAVKASANSWFDESPLQSFAQLFGGNSYSSNQQTDIAGNLLSVAEDFPLSFFPALMGAAARGTGQVQRNTYDRTSGIATFANKAKAKIPGLADTLPASYDTWGREKKYGRNFAESLASQMVIPGQFGFESDTPVDVEINRLFDATGDNRIFPHKAEYTVNKQKLTNEEQSEYQRDMGQLSYQLAEAFINSPVYADMDDETKAARFNSLFSFADSITKNQLFDSNIDGEYKKAVEAYNEAGGGQAGAEAAIDLIVQSSAIKDLGGRNDERYNRIYEQYGADGVTAYINAHENANVDGAGSVTQQDALDYMTQHPDAPDWLISELVSAEGTFKKEGNVWNYYDKKGNLKKTGRTVEQMNQTAQAETATSTTASNIPSLTSGTQQGYESFQKIPSLADYSPEAYAQMFKAIDTGNDGKTQKDELVAFLDSQNWPQSVKYDFFEAHKLKSNTGNPY